MLPRSLTRRDFLRAGAGAMATTALQPLRLPLVATSDLAVALGAARWIATTRIKTPDGVTWLGDPLDPKSAGVSLYHGSPGVVLFLDELAAATGDTSFLDEACLGADHLGAALQREPELDAGLYTGVAGLVFCLDRTSRASGRGRYREIALRGLKLLEERAQPAGAGVAWNESADIISGNAGIGLLLLYAHREMKAPGALDLAVRAGRRLVELGQPAANGLKWAIAPSVQQLYPNFSHGAAGAGFFLARLYQETGERAFLDVALAAARYLDAAATKVDGGFSVFHHEPGGEDLYYLSWCHGPAGTARLFYQLAQVTGDASWMEFVWHAARATELTGIPERRTPGFWENISQCCGGAGVGEFFLTLYRLSAKAPYLEMARRNAADILRRSTREGDGLKWVQAEHRVRPELLVAQTGLMQGAAGVGTFFLHLDAVEKRRAPGMALPDSPFA